MKRSSTSVSRWALLVVLAAGVFPATAQPFSQTTHNLPALFPGLSAWVDYDSDGDADILLAGNDGLGGQETRLYRNAGGESFEQIPLPPTGHSHYGFSVFWGDNNGDALPDKLLTAIDESGRPIMVIFHQESDRTFIDSGGAPSR